MRAHSYPHLFSSINIGCVEIKNRIAMMPMGVFSPRLMGPCGAYTKDGADYYIARAKGGVGLIITGLLPVGLFPPGQGPQDPGEGFQKYVEQQTYLARGVHQYGAKIFVQISALTGRVGASPAEPAACAIQNVWDPTQRHREMTVEEIRATIDKFACAALACKLAGLDGVEVHAVHEGYLLDQFTISATNTRNDQYGGSLDNRLRFPCEIVQAIKKACGRDFPVSLRYSVRSYMKGFNRGALPGEDFVEFGRDFKESVQVARKFEEAGYDLLNCDNGSYDSWYWAHPPVYMPKACNLDDVRALKKHLSIPVICAGKFDDPQLADEMIARGEIDMMGMGRPLLADPEIVNKFAQGTLEDIRPCIGCHQGCLSRIFQFKDICCAVNPACARETSYRLEKAKTIKKVLVVGGGLAGMEAARVCALRGHRVELCEKTDHLGGVFVAASTQDYKEDDRRLLAWYIKQMKDLNIHVRTQTEVTAAWLERKDYDEIFIATGAVERTLDIPGFDAPNVTYAVDTLLKNKVSGQNVLVVGGGLTGIEIACDLARQGKKVTVVEATDTIINAFGVSAANYNMLMDMLDYYRVTVLKGTTVTRYENGQARLQTVVKNFPNQANRARWMYTVGAAGVIKTSTVAADHVIVSVGYVSDKQIYDDVKKENVHFIGDVDAPGNVMKAIWDAFETARNV